ncbi:hypothetical protein CEXT_25251 [Caerostris extrusa]|uniref:Uncharacterized protein n=1 Tax=Caerostris extrusa TaxID=172846 RepID=A0AAV4S8S0_CAEEX|nr:hypothetical protein CEXT_25251 [Caerostris extrusa]
MTSCLVVVLFGKRNHRGKWPSLQQVLRYLMRNSANEEEKIIKCYRIKKNNKGNQKLAKMLVSFHGGKRIKECACVGDVFWSLLVAAAGKGKKKKNSNQFVIE